MTIASSSSAVSSSVVSSSGSTGTNADTYPALAVDNTGNRRQSFLAALSQVGLLGALFMLYREGRLLSANRTDVAFHNAVNLWHLERWLHLPNEVWLQELALHAHWLILMANRYYVAVHFPLTATVLVWLYIRHKAHYRRARTILIAVTFPALVLQVGFPVAPPRFMNHLGLVDTMAAFGPSAYSHIGGAANQLAAMPSLHVGWALLLAVVTWRLPMRWTRIVFPLHAFITIVVVTITANHYLIDGLVGAALVVVATLAYDYNRARVAVPKRVSTPAQIDLRQTSPSRVLAAEESA